MFFLLRSFFVYIANTNHIIYNWLCLFRIFVLFSSFIFLKCILFTLFSSYFNIFSIIIYLTIISLNSPIKIFSDCHVTIYLFYPFVYLYSFIHIFPHFFLFFSSFIFVSFLGYGDLSVEPFTYRKPKKDSLKDGNNLDNNTNNTANSVNSNINNGYNNGYNNSNYEVEDGDPCDEGNILTPYLETMAQKGKILFCIRKAKKSQLSIKYILLKIIFKLLIWTYCDVRNYILPNPNTHSNLHVYVCMHMYMRIGITFTNFHSASPVCSPSRAAVMTGLFPWRYVLIRLNTV